MCVCGLVGFFLLVCLFLKKNRSGVASVVVINVLIHMSHSRNSPLTWPERSHVLAIFSNPNARAEHSLINNL